MISNNYASYIMGKYSDPIIPSKIWSTSNSFPVATIMRYSATVTNTPSVSFQLQLIGILAPLPFLPGTPTITFNTRSILLGIIYGGCKVYNIHSNQIKSLYIGRLVPNQSTLPLILINPFYIPVLMNSSWAIPTTDVFHEIL